ncbi:hypothetical protein LIER_21056 [Lithospermum erythrorhizon]|uniref:Uncharacterized protein n=1 Tax=Lithospermum erythrorhizon TaxID=34254 RepID=A0AAV3QPS2_LITER
MPISSFTKYFRKAINLISATTTVALSTTTMEPLTPLKTRICIIGSGPNTHTAAIYTARAEQNPLSSKAGWLMTSRQVAN